MTSPTAPIPDPSLVAAFNEQASELFSSFAAVLVPILSAFGTALRPAVEAACTALGMMLDAADPWSPTRLARIERHAIERHGVPESDIRWAGPDHVRLWNGRTIPVEYVR